MGNVLSCMSAEKPEQIAEPYRNARDIHWEVVKVQKAESEDSQQSQDSVGKEYRLFQSKRDQIERYKEASKLLFKLKSEAHLLKCVLHDLYAGYNAITSGGKMILILFSTGKLDVIVAAAITAHQNVHLDLEKEDSHVELEEESSALDILQSRLRRISIFPGSAGDDENAKYKNKSVEELDEELNCITSLINKNKADIREFKAKLNTLEEEYEKIHSAPVCKKVPGLKRVIEAATSNILQQEEAKEEGRPVYGSLLKLASKAKMVAQDNRVVKEIQNSILHLNITKPHNDHN